MRLKKRERRMLRERGLTFTKLFKAAKELKKSGHECTDDHDRAECLLLHLIDNDKEVQDIAFGGILDWDWDAIIDLIVNKIIPLIIKIIGMF